MGLPKAIQAQIEQADEMVQRMNAEVPPNPEPQDPPQDPPGEPVVNEPIPVVPPAPVPEETWEQKFHTLQGKYQAEVPRMNEQLREMRDAISQLMAENTSLRTAPKPEATEPKVSLVTDADREAFGADLIDLAERIAKQHTAKVERLAAEQANEIKDLKSKLGTVDTRVAVSDQDRFFMALEKNVSDWEAVNTDQKFLGWLAEVDPVYGHPRQAALTDAFQRLDVTRVAAIFNTFKQLNGSNAPAAPTGNQELRRQVAPTRSRTASVPTDNTADQRIWTQRDIAQFYDQSMKGYIDKDEAVRIEKEIEAAVSQGRVR